MHESGSILNKKALIAYFSWSGNTHRIASQIHQVVGGDIFKIQTKNNYPSNYKEVLTIGKQEIRSGATPELKEKLPGIEPYDYVFIGYPNWWNTFPAPVLSFLREYDFTGKTIIPFCTHGGGGNGHSFADVAKQCTSARVLPGFAINGYSARAATKEVSDWINNIK